MSPKQIPSAQQLNEQLDPLCWPIFETVEGDAASLQFSMRIVSRLCYFRGHFPEQAVLPGVVQVHWAGELARRWLGCEAFTCINQVKFNQPIMPETSAELSMQYRPASGRLNFRYQYAGQTFSSGVMTFKATA